MGGDDDDNWKSDKEAIRSSNSLVAEDALRGAGWLICGCDETGAWLTCCDDWLTVAWYGTGLLFEGLFGLGATAGGTLLDDP